MCRTVDRYQWLQVDLRSQDISVTGLATQGRNDWNQWVIQYNVQYSYDGDDFKYYTENGQSPKVWQNCRMLSMNVNYPSTGLFV